MDLISRRERTDLADLAMAVRYAHHGEAKVYDEFVKRLRGE